MLNTFKSGSTHMAIVCNDPALMVEEADKVLEAIKRGTDMQLSIGHHEILGITTLEKVLEEILNMPILDEKDIEKIRNKENRSVTMH
jgi:CBS domain containing-hemolysin-like protein